MSKNTDFNNFGKLKSTQTEIFVSQKWQKHWQSIE